MVRVQTLLGVFGPVYAKFGTVRSYFAGQVAALLEAADSWAAAIAATTPWGRMYPAVVHPLASKTEKSACSCEHVGMPHECTTESPSPLCETVRYFSTRERASSVKHCGALLWARKADKESAHQSQRHIMAGAVLSAAPTCNCRAYRGGAVAAHEAVAAHLDGLFWPQELLHPSRLLRGAQLHLIGAFVQVRERDDGAGVRGARAAVGGGSPQGGQQAALQGLQLPAVRPRLRGAVACRGGAAQHGSVARKAHVWHFIRGA